MPQRLEECGRKSAAALGGQVRRVRRLRRLRRLGAPKGLAQDPPQPPSVLNDLEAQGVSA